MKSKTYFKQIVSLLCVISLLLTIFVFGSAQAVAETETTQSSVIVSMGDSYSSGEGIEDFYGQYDDIKDKVKNEDWLAHRSKNAWSGQLTLDGISKMSDDKFSDNEKDREYKQDGNWFFVASSGATTGDINYSQKKEYKKKGIKKGSYDLPPQINVFKTLRSKNKKANYVTLTLGGNDADFSGVIITAACSPSYLLPNIIYNKIKDIYDYNLNDIKVSLGSVYYDIAKEAGAQAKILVGGYPHLLDKDGKGFVVNKYEATLINKAVDDFNDTISDEVKLCQKKINIDFVPIDFNNHEAYSDETQKGPIADKNIQMSEINNGKLKGEFINRILLLPQEQDLRNDRPSAYSIHPNLRGAEAYRKCFQDKINDLEKEKNNNSSGNSGSVKLQNDKALNNKITELTKKYGIASTETYKKENLTFDDCGWCERDGLLSAKLMDLDGDSINELLTVRCPKKIKQDSVGRSYTELIIEVFSSTNGKVKSAGQYKLENTNDCETAQVNVFTYKTKNKTYLCYERDFRGLLVDYHKPEYYVFEYSNNALNKVMRLYQAFMGTSGTDLTQIIWRNGKEKKISIQSSYSIFKNNKEKHVFKGKYKNSDYPFDEAMIDFGFKKSAKGLFGESRKRSRYLSYAYQNSSEKVCSISVRQLEKNVYDAVKSSVFDYTGLNHSKAVSKPKQEPEWKNAYINYIKNQESGALSSYSFNIVDVDENKIPELVFTADVAHGTQILWIKDNKVQSQKIGYGEFKYISSSRLIYCSYLNHGLFYDNVLNFNSEKNTQELDCVFSGSIVPKDDVWKYENPGWYINNKSVSESKYKSELNSAFNFDAASSLNYDEALSGDDLYKAIKNF